MRHWRLTPQAFYFGCGPKRLGQGAGSGGEVVHQQPPVLTWHLRRILNTLLLPEMLLSGLDRC